jgi:thioredoxin reductase (NADPH)
MPNTEHAEVIIVGGGPAGLSAAAYLGRALRDTLVIDEGKSMARWEPDVQNYLGFPTGVDGKDLLRLGREQARRYQARFRRDRILRATARKEYFHLRGRKGLYSCHRLLLATGIFHIPPDIPGVDPCLGHSMFFCKDCDGYRVQGKTVAVYGCTNESVRYALGMLLYSPRVLIVTDGRRPKWDREQARHLNECRIPVWTKTIRNVRHHGNHGRALEFEDCTELLVDAVFTTRGDIYFNELAKGFGARVDKEGQILVDANMRTSVKGLYAAGCVTPANCQMIIAAGQGATAAQAINHDLLEESLVTHSLRRFRARQLRTRRTDPAVRKRKATRGERRDAGSSSSTAR